jgi:diguanylate cyclase (GGDEF)-like protein
VTFVALGILALGALGLLVYMLLQLRLQNQTLELQHRALEEELGVAHDQVARAGNDQLFIARLVRELPHTLHELHSAPSARQVPGLLMSAATRNLEPRRALVAVRRRAVQVDQDRHMRLVVAAAFPTTWIALGEEIRIGHGEIGYAAEVQRVMDRHDFEALAPHLGTRLRQETQRFKPDVVAPMVFKDELMGVLAVEGGKNVSKDAVRLLAQVGAVALHTHARYVEMKATAAIDSLTGIFNKRYLTHRLADEMRLCLELGRRMSLFIFDVDHFKAYNDRNGHVAGDWLLRELVKLVHANIRKDDAVFGRYGGEEFVILFTGATREQALAAAENVRQVVASHEFALGPQQPLGFVSISGGVAEAPADGQDVARLLRAADAALQEAGAPGRGVRSDRAGDADGEHRCRRPGSSPREGVRRPPRRRRRPLQGQAGRTQPRAGARRGSPRRGCPRGGSLASRAGGPPGNHAGARHAALARQHHAVQRNPLADAAAQRGRADCRGEGAEARQGARRARGRGRGLGLSRAGYG